MRPARQEELRRYIRETLAHATSGASDAKATAREGLIGIISSIWLAGGETGAELESLDLGLTRELLIKRAKDDVCVIELEIYAAFLELIVTVSKGGGSGPFH